MIDDFMDFVGFRNIMIESKIDECLDDIRMGETDYDIDEDVFTDEEISYVKREIKRRLEEDEF